MNKAQMLILVSSLVYSSLGFSYGTSVKTIATQQFVCDLKGENGINTQMTLIRTLKEESHHQVASSRSIEVMFYESNLNKSLAQQLVIELNSIKPDDSEPDRSESHLVNGEVLTLFKVDSKLGLETVLPALKTEKIEIRNNNFLSLEYTNKNFSYNDSIPISVEMNVTQVSDKSFNLDADLYYSVYVRDEKSPRKVKLTEKEVGLVGNCQAL